MLVDKVRADWKVSARRACSVLKIDRSSMSTSPGRRAGRTEVRIKDICQTRVRYGYRRVHVLLKRDGWPVNPKRIYRLYKEGHAAYRHQRLCFQYRQDPQDSHRQSHNSPSRLWRQPQYHKRIQEVFGWIKAQAGLAKVKLRTRQKVAVLFRLAIAAYNFVRLPKLIAQAAPPPAHNAPNRKPQRNYPSPFAPC
ncbi:hypothetical protein AJ87_11485 [Rhizobium yanglingense]|nr:hypothetical protein AJ87_11485 [Rhizobium yanglingense]